MSHSKLWQHLAELRKRLAYCVIVLFGLVCLLIGWSNNLYQYIALPLIKHLPQGHNLIATAVTSTFTVPLKLVLFVSVLISMPFMLYQLWMFIAPALYRQEKHWLWPTLCLSSGLFYFGLIFAYWIVLPIVLKFFISLTPSGVTFMPDIGHYLSFVMRLCLAFGVVFQVPIITVGLIRFNIINAETLARQRPYIIVGAFILGMLLTPPDIISQIMLAIPIWLLFEIGLLWVKFRPTTKETRLDT